MRKWIIDTDTGSDDAVAIMMAVLSEDIDVLGITAVAGNVPLDLAVKNALMTLEVCGSPVKVYPGQSRPLFRKPVTAVNVHGDDGMGDRDLIHPVRKAEEEDAVDFLIRMAKLYGNELEIVMIGPATNIAAAILKDREAMSKIKRLYSMGTAGFGPGNCTPVSEFNVYADAEAYRIVLEAGIPMTIIGFDMCIGKAAWDMEDMSRISSSGPIGKFAVDCNTALLNYNIRRADLSIVDLPDAVAVGVALWPDIVTDSRHCYCYCHIQDDRCYGQVIVYDPSGELVIGCPDDPANADVIAGIDTVLYKQRLEELLTGH